MVKKLLIMLVVLSVTGSAWAALSDGSVVWWEFENNTNDSSANGNHGSWVGSGAYAAGVPYKPGGSVAASFNGASYVQDTTPTGMPWADDYDPSRGEQFSMNVFVKGTEPWGDWDGIFGWGTYTSSQDRTLTTRNGTAVWFHGHTNNDSVGFDLTDGNWHMITFVFDQTPYIDTGSDWRGDKYLYIDNQLVASRTYSYLNDTSGTPPIWAGYWVSRTGASYWDGLIDEPAVWNRPLTASERDELYSWMVPEPATIALLGLGGLALIRRKR